MVLVETNIKLNRVNTTAGKLTSQTTSFSFPWETCISKWRKALLEEKGEIGEGSFSDFLTPYLLVCLIYSPALTV